MTPELIGERIRHIRHKQKLTQQELAKKIGVSWEMVSRYERGASSPFNKLDGLAKALNVSPAELLQNSFNSSTLNDSSINRIPYYVALPKRMRFTKGATHYFYAAPDWVIKTDPEVFLIDHSLLTIKTAQIARNGPLYIAPSLKDYSTEDVLLFASKRELLVDLYRNRTAELQIIGIVIAQELRFDRD